MNVRLKMTAAALLIILCSLFCLGAAQQTHFSFTGIFSSVSSITSADLSISGKTLSTTDKIRIDSLLNVLLSSNYTKTSQYQPQNISYFANLYSGEHLKMLIFGNDDYIYLNSVCYKPDQPQMISRLKDWYKTQSSYPNTDNKTCVIAG